VGRGDQLHGFVEGGDAEGEKSAVIRGSKKLRAIERPVVTCVGAFAPSAATFQTCRSPRFDAK
jgi:hypothetical protein